MTEPHYTPYHGRRYLARRLYETFMEKAMDWLTMDESFRRRWEHDVEVLLDPRREEVREAMRALGWRHEHYGP